MSSIIASSHITLILGLGLTGLSVARHLHAQGKSVALADTREQPPMLAQLRALYPNAPVWLGPLDFQHWQGISEIVISPGLSLADPALDAARAAGIPIVGDIELFARVAQAPIVAITGSNGKTTVTSLVGEMARRAGVAVKVGGNLGTPALDLLDPQAELYVLELSSFQLESTMQLNAKVATVLNISADHLDRHGNLPNYLRAKQRIYFGAAHLVVNQNDPLTQPPLGRESKVVRFGLNEPDLNDFGVRIEQGEAYLAHGLKALLPVKALAMRGDHNVSNALAALALGNAAGLPMAAMVATLETFSGLPHRCQFVARYNEVDFYNDSKATNVGAAVAALNGLASVTQKQVLIAGGDGKGASFDDLRAPLAQHVRALVTLGKDGLQLAQVCPEHIPHQHCRSMAEAVAVAVHWALPGDAVVLSPACASLDMFNNYEDRGDQFIQQVEALCSPCL